ncbi:hypothetical protein [Nocardia sp. NPDC005745]|uniref:PIN domain-containing protein n=1 Tax=Nocardia sp. NPDC005745 TaxID=3157061 RepID=UPI0033DAE64E
MVDANILVSANNLRRNPWNNLVERQEEWGFRFAVPEVALLEAVHTIRSRWAEELAKVSALQIAALELDHLTQDLHTLISEKIDELEQGLRGGLAGMGASIVAPPAIDYIDIVKRAIYRTPLYNDRSSTSSDHCQRR